MHILSFAPGIHVVISSVVMAMTMMIALPYEHVEDTLPLLMDNS
jgi:hypothetical protein